MMMIETLVLLAISLTGVSYKTMDMYEVVNNYTSLWSSSAAVATYNQTQTLLECAIRCLGHMETCSALAHDQVTLTCQLGECTISHPESKNSSVHLLQTEPDLCNSTPGFQVERNGHTSACLWWSGTKKNFYDARADCKAKGSIMATFKTLEKFNILKQKYNQQSYSMIYVGLDDMSVEGVFRWHDDGSVLNMTYCKQIFISGEPNNYNNIEDCVAIWGNGLNDFPCSQAYNYVCEKTCFRF